MSHNRIIATTLVALGCTTLVGTLFAQSLQITSTIDNAIIMVRNIFLSPTGRDIGNNASIKLEGDQGGNITIGGDLILSNDRYSCPDSDGTGCVFAVQPDGSTALTEVALPQATTVIEDDVTITGDSFFAKKGGSTDHLNRSANEIVFADPDIVPNAADAHLRVDIKDVVRATSTGTPKMFDVNGAINSRTSLEVSSPLDTTQKSNYNLTDTARTDFILTKGDSATNEQSVRMKVGYNNGAQYTRQDMIIDSLGDTGARLGINTSGYPEYTLDVNGETLSQEILTVGYLNSGNIVTNIRQAVGIVIQSPSPSAQTAIRSQSCDRAPIPATLQCSNGNCSTISLSGNEIASFTCYDWVGTNTTMQRAQMYQIMPLYSSVTMIANTDTQSVGINTLVPQSTLDVNGDTYLDGSGYIIGTPNNIASITNGNTSIQLKELNNTESTPYTGGNTNCKGLSVDEAGHIILVQLPRTMCGATGSIVTPPTPVINGVCGSSHNTTGTSAPTTNLCTTGTASSVAGNDPWTWSCAGSNGGTSASCQMNKESQLCQGGSRQNTSTCERMSAVYRRSSASLNGISTAYDPGFFRVPGCLAKANNPANQDQCLLLEMPEDGTPELPVGYNFVSTCQETEFYPFGYTIRYEPYFEFYMGEDTTVGNNYTMQKIVGCGYDDGSGEEPTTFQLGCFLADTQITLFDGSKISIQDIKVGDRLLGVEGVNTVQKLIRPSLGNQKVYSINGSDTFFTANHPFLTTAGWKSLDPDTTKKEIPELTVSLLRVGDIIISEQGWAPIYTLSFDHATADTQLYNFELDGDHTYFANGFAVHNKIPYNMTSCMTDNQCAMYTESYCKRDGIDPGVCIQTRQCTTNSQCAVGPSIGDGITLVNGICTAPLTINNGMSNTQNRKYCKW